MQRKSFTATAIFLFCFAVLPAWSQPDPLLGRWEGVMKTQRGDFQVVARFSKEANRYSGTITGLQGAEVPFKEVKVDKDKINAKLQIQTQGGTQDLNIRFVLKGDVLEGKADFRMGPQVMTFNYVLNRAPDMAALQPGPVTPEIGMGTQEEFEAYNQLRAEPDAAAKKLMIETYAQKYPESGLLAHVYQEGAFLGRQTDNVQMMSEYGEKSLGLWPDNYVLLTELASAYVQRNEIDKAERHAEHAIEIVSEAAKPDQVTEEQWAQGRKMLLGTNFSTLGFVHLRRAQGKQDPEERKSGASRSVAPFKKALEYQPRDDYALYGLGFAHVMLDDYESAESTLAKAVAVNGIIADNARGLLEDIYKGKHNDSLEGLDKVIAKARSELGLP